MSTGFVYLRPLNVVSVRAKGPYARSAAEAWDKMFAWLRQSGALEPTGAGYGLLFDDPRVVASEACRYEACVEVREEFRNRIPDSFSLRRLPGGAYTRKRHIGGTKGLGIAISKLRSEGIPAQGLQLDSRRPVIEIYLDNDQIVPLAQQRIDLCMPITVNQETGRSAA